MVPHSQKLKGSVVPPPPLFPSPDVLSVCSLEFIVAFQHIIICYYVYCVQFCCLLLSAFYGLCLLLLRGEFISILPFLFSYCDFNFILSFRCFQQLGVLFLEVVLFFCLQSSLYYFSTLLYALASTVILQFYTVIYLLNRIIFNSKASSNSSNIEINITYSRQLSKGIKINNMTLLWLPTTSLGTTSAP